MTPEPSLFGITHSNRNFRNKNDWSKNKFNSAFPAALIAYMSSVQMNCIYIKLGSSNTLEIDYLSPEELFGCDPLDDDLYYSFENYYTPFGKFCLHKPPKVDLLLKSKSTNRIYSGFEIKLTTIPDESTCGLSEEFYGCELVIRMPSIQFLACSLASIYYERTDDLKKYFGQYGFGNVASYQEAAQINPRLGDIWDRMSNLIGDNLANQQPSIIQPIWKTKGKSSQLADNCLDVFIWSDLAFTKLFMNEANKVAPAEITRPINRPTRALVQLFFMLNEVSVRGRFDHKEIFQKLTYTMKNDKAFSISGRRTNPMMSCPELIRPRIKRNELKNIILNGGQNLLSPERRFDAALFYSSDIF